MKTWCLFVVSINHIYGAVGPVVSTLQQYKTPVRIVSLPILMCDQSAVIENNQCWSFSVQHSVVLLVRLLNVMLYIQVTERVHSETMIKHILDIFALKYSWHSLPT
jgi:hypothetical protein